MKFITKNYNINRGEIHHENYLHGDNLFHKKFFILFFLIFVFM